MGPRVRRRKIGVLVGVVVLNMVLAEPATAGVEPVDEGDFADADATEVRAFLRELFADDPGEPGRWEWDPAPPASREMRFPSGESLPVVPGPVAPGEEHHDPNSSGLPLLDVGGEHRDTRLAPDVTAGELARSGGRQFEVARIDPNLVACLQRIRSLIDEPVEVMSGYRSYGYNVELYRARDEEPTDSQHSSGRAIDITIDGHSGLDAARAAVRACGCELGVGVGDDFAHVDVRGEDSSWSYLDGDAAEEALQALADHREQRCVDPTRAEAAPGKAAGADADAGGAGEGLPATPYGMTPGGLLAAPAEVLDDLREALRSHEFSEAVDVAVANGLWDENQLTDIIFFVSHPELRGRQLQAGESELAATWLRLRDDVVRPALAEVAAFIGMPDLLGDPPGPVRGSAWLRRAWDGHACEDEIAMVSAAVLGSRVQAHPWTVEALAAFDGALRAAGYEAGSAGIYHCRDIRGNPGQLSLHAYGLAIDVDPACHPHRVGEPGPARFSPGPTQEDRCRDVQASLADTAFTPAQVEAVERIRTVDGLQVFTWGGRWRSSPDGMHFQINVSPDELRRGIE